jgi:hypothetical protein
MGSLQLFLLMFANYSDSSRAFLRLRLPLTPPSAPLSPMGEGIGGEGFCHYIWQSWVGNKHSFQVE